MTKYFGIMNIVICQTLFIFKPVTSVKILESKYSDKRP